MQGNISNYAGYYFIDTSPEIYGTRISAMSYHTSLYHEFLSVIKNYLNYFVLFFRYFRFMPFPENTLIDPQMKKVGISYFCMVNRLIFFHSIDTIDLFDYFKSLLGTKRHLIVLTAPSISVPKMYALTSFVLYP